MAQRLTPRSSFLSFCPPFTRDQRMLTVIDFECLPIHFAFSKINVVFVYTQQFKREIEGEESVCLCLHCIDKFDEPMMCTENNTAQHNKCILLHSFQ